MTGSEGTAPARSTRAVPGHGRSGPDRVGSRPPGPGPQGTGGPEGGPAGGAEAARPLAAWPPATAGAGNGDPAPGPTAPDGVTVADILELEPLREVRVLAGHRALGRPVRLVNVIEVPDIVDWVLEGELLLTTGFTFRDDPAQLAALIPGLAAKGAAGLGIKPRRYVAEIPTEAVAQAERHGLPLLEIPYHLSFAEIIGPVMQAIAHRQAAATLVADRLQRELLDLVLRDAGLEALCTAVARHLNRPVWIEDATGAVVAAAAPPAPPPEAAAAGAPPASPPEAAASGAPPLPPPGPAWRVPVASGGRFFGSLCAASPGRAPLPSETGLLERGAAIVGLEWGKQAAVTEVQRRYRTEFLDRLLGGTLQDPAEILERSRTLGWALDRPHTVVVFGTVDRGGWGSLPPSPPSGPAAPGRAPSPGPAAPSAGSPPPSGRPLPLLLRTVEMVLSMEGGEPVVGVRDGLVVALIPGDPADPAGRHRILTVAKAVLRSYASSAGTGRGTRGPLAAAGWPASGPLPAGPEGAPGGTGSGSRAPGGRAGSSDHRASPSGGRAAASPERAPWSGGRVEPGPAATPPAPAVAAGVGRVAAAPTGLARSYREAYTAWQAARAMAAARAAGTWRAGAGKRGDAAASAGSGRSASPRDSAGSGGAAGAGRSTGSRGAGGSRGAAAAAGSPARAGGRPTAAAPLGEPVQFFADLGVLRLLHHQPAAELAAFVDDHLGPLLAYDRRHDGKLLETLEAFFRFGGNMKRMARALYTHYNTVAYRLQRIRQITGLDLKDPDQLLSLQVALCALPLLDGLPPRDEPAADRAGARGATGGGAGP